MKKIFFSYRKENGYEDVFESDSVMELGALHKINYFPTENIMNVAIDGKPAPKEITTISQLLNLLPPVVNVEALNCMTGFELRMPTKDTTQFDY